MYCSPALQFHHLSVKEKDGSILCVCVRVHSLTSFHRAGGPSRIIRRRTWASRCVAGRGRGANVSFVRLRDPSRRGANVHERLNTGTRFKNLSPHA